MEFPKVTLNLFARSLFSLICKEPESPNFSGSFKNLEFIIKFSVIKLSLASMFFASILTSSDLKTNFYLCL